MFFMHTVRVVTTLHARDTKLYTSPGTVLANGLVSIVRARRLKITVGIKEVARTATTLIPTNGS